MQVWSLSCEYLCPDQRGGSVSVEYTADNAADAVAMALRWMKGREALPELFHNFLYFQIHPVTLGPIDENGNLTGRTGFRLMEWSRDRAGVDKETYCEWKIAEFSRPPKG